MTLVVGKINLLTSRLMRGVSDDGKKFQSFMTMFKQRHRQTYKRSTSIDGWTTVTRTGRGRAHPRPPHNGKSTTTVDEDDDDDDDDGVQVLQREYIHHRQRWERSTCRHQLQDILRQHQHPLSTIDRVICLGLGSLSSGPHHARRRSMYQLAALMTIVGCIGMTFVSSVQTIPRGVVGGPRSLETDGQR